MLLKMIPKIEAPWSFIEWDRRHLLGGAALLATSAYLLQRCRRPRPVVFDVSNVRPTRAPSSEVEELSSLDQLLFGTPLAFALRFDVLLDEDQVRSALCEALNVMPSAAGRHMTKDASHIVLGSPSFGGVPFETRRLQTGRCPASDKWSTCDLWVTAATGVVGGPLTRARLTRFEEDNCSVLSVAFSHGWGDAQSCHEFLRLWGHFCSKATTTLPSLGPGVRVVTAADPKSCTEESIAAEWNARCPTSPSPAGPFSMFRVMRHAMYNFFTCNIVDIEVDVNKLGELKKKLMVGRVGWFSSWELLIAIILKARMTTQPGPMPAEYTVIVNCRERNSKYHPQYIGNAVLEQNFPVPSITGPDHSVADLADKIHDHIRGFIADGDGMPWIFGIYDKVVAMKKGYANWTIQGAFSNKLFWFNSFATYPWLEIRFCDAKAVEYSNMRIPIPMFNFFLLTPSRPGKQYMPLALTKAQTNAAVAQLREFDCLTVTSR